MAATSFRRALVLASVLASAGTWACGTADGEAGPPADQAKAEAYAPGPPRARPGAARQSAAAAPDSGIDVDALGYTRGSDAAPVRVVEFSDFGCGYCRQFNLETWPTLERKYVATGKVQWKMIPFDIGTFPHSHQADLAGECAGEQGRFEDLRPLLFQEQKSWKSGTEGTALDVLRKMAAGAGLDMDRFNRCMAQGWRAARMSASAQLARQLGIRGTPTFYILGYGIIPGALPAEQFSAVLDKVLAREAGEHGS